MPTSRAVSILEEHKLRHLFIDLEEYEARPAIIDLFCGVGGLSLGFRAAGFKVALAIDNDKQAHQAYSQNFPETLPLYEDINNFAKEPQKYLEEVGLTADQIVGVIGGPPCQGFSYLGERSSRDERNLLVSKFMDVVLCIKPIFFVMENVPGLATSGTLPKFSTYIRRIAKTNGEPASSIVDKLPLSSKSAVQRVQRTRQFRKKLVSTAISRFKSEIDNHFDRSSPLLIDLETPIISLHQRLRAILVESVELNYDISAEGLMENIEIELGMIVLASILEFLLTNKLVPIKDAQAHFEQLKLSLPNIGSLCEAATKITEDYVNAPPARMYRGRKLGPVLLHLLERASELYEIPTPKVINAASFGAPQNRERMFIVGIRRDLGKTFEYPVPTHSVDAGGDENSTPTVHDALHDLPDIDTMPHLIQDHEFSVKELSRPESRFAAMMRCELVEEDDLSLPRASWNPYSMDSSNRTTHERVVQERIKVLAPGGLERVSRKVRLHRDRLAPTLRAGTRESKGSHTAVRPIHYKYHRVISVREGARLMGYPDWMTFHKTKWHGFRLVGNGVPFALSKAIAKQVKNLVVKEKQDMSCSTK